MPIDATSPTDPLTRSAVGGGDGSLAGAADSTLGRDQFLKLLMAQLENQDPMSPMENHELVAQLATFSGLEQQVLANQKLDQLQLAQMSLSNAQLSNFIGKEITARGDTISIDDGKTEPLGINLEGPATSVTVTVKDASGKPVYTGERENMSAGNHEITWPGTDANGTPLPAGDYTVSVEATDGEGNPVGAAALVTGVVTGVTFEHGYPELLVGDLRVQPADIIHIGESDALPVPLVPSPPPPPAQPGPGLGLG